MTAVDELEVVHASEVGPGPGRRWLAPAAASSLAVIVLVQQLVLVATWFRHEVNEDLALLWAAARSWGELEPHQPNFWGQTYGSTLEAIPTEVLRRIGVSYPTGLPVVLMVLHLGSWWIPAAAAWRRGHRLLAAVAIAAPALLTTEYVISASIYGAAIGRFVAGLVVAIVIARTCSVGWTAAACGIAALVLQLDSSTVLMTVPACIVGVAVTARATRTAPARWRAAGVLAAALVPAAAWRVFSGAWYRRHPGDDLHPAPAIRPMRAVLADNLHHLSRHFAPYSLELVRSPIIPILVILGLGIALAAQRRPAAVAAYIAVLGITIFTLALPKSLDRLDTVFFQAARVLLPLPMAVWFLATRVEVRPLAPRTVRAIAAALAALVAVTGIVRIATWSERGGRLEEEANAFPGFAQTPTEDLVRLCGRVEVALDTADTSVAWFELRTAAYGCAGVIGPSVTTVFPEYDRRSWVLEELDRPGPSSMLFVGRRPPSCDAPGGVTCVQLFDDIVEVELDDRAPLEVVRTMGVTPRPF